jgi:hypothetical protein
LFDLLSQSVMLTPLAIVIFESVFERISPFRLAEIFLIIELSKIRSSDCINKLKKPVSARALCEFWIVVLCSST